MGFSRAIWLFLLATATAQEPSEPLAGLRYLPKSAPVVVGVKDLSRRWPEIQKTGLGRILGHAAVQKLIEQHVTPLLEQARGGARANGVELDDLLRVVADGTTVAITGVKARGPEVLMVVDLGAQAAALGNKLAEQLTKTGATRVAMVPAGVEWLFSVDKPRAWVVALDGAHLLLAAEQSTIQSCVARARASAGGSELSRDPEFQAFQRRGGSSQALVTALVRPGNFASLIEQNVQPRSKVHVEKFLEHSGLNALKLLGYTVRVAGENVEDSLVLSMSARKGLLALLPSPAATPLRAMPAPQSAASITLTRFAPAKALDALMDVCDAVEPGVKAMVDLVLQENRNRTGVDLRDDLLGTLGEQWMVAAGAASAPEGFPDFWVVGELADAKGFTTALRKLLSVQAERGQRIEEHGDEGWSLPVTPGTSLGITTAGGKLILGVRGPEFTRLIAACTRNEASPRLVELTKGLPGDAVSVAWSNPGATGGALLSSLGERFPGADSVAALGQVADLLGESRTVVRGSATSIDLVTTSSCGSFYGMAALGVAAAVTLPNALSSRGSGRQTAGETGPSVTMAPEVLAQVHASELTLREQSREFGSITRLAASGLLDPLGGQAAEESGGIVVRGWRVHVILPETMEQRIHHYAVVAVPQRRGMPDPVAFFADERGTIWSNRVILKLGGEDRLTEADLYEGGRFGGNPLPGWEKHESAAVPLQRVQSSRTLEDLTLPERLDAIVRAEKAKDRAAIPQLMVLLKDTTPGIAARAAYALGELRAVVATDALVQLAQQTTDSQTRSHAIFALARIKDRRAVMLLHQALTDAEPRVRAAAATGLGELKVQESAPALLKALLEGNKDHAEVQTQIVLALADIGDPECLARVSAGIKVDQGPLAQSLGYLFQSLSPKLPEEQETQLLLSVLAHENPVLRKYAIQRLGEARRTEALPALRARLAAETKELVPVLKNTIEALAPAPAQGPRSGPPAPPAKGRSREPIGGSDADQGVLAPVMKTLDEAARTLEEYGVTREIGWGAGGGIALVGCILFWLARRRREEEPAARPWSYPSRAGGASGSGAPDVNDVPAPPRGAYQRQRSR